MERTDSDVVPTALDDASPSYSANKVQKSRKLKHKCSSCSLFFYDIRNLKNHMLVCRAKNVFPCEKCKARFYSEERLADHRACHMPHKCTICNKTFASTASLDTHLRNHLGTLPYKCTMCDKGYATSYDLRNHQNRHLGIKPHKCTFCEQSFVTTYELKGHMNRHQNIKPHKCGLCKSAFTSTFELNTHLANTHLVTAPHKCFLCEGSFKTSAKFNAHLLQHLGLQPYKCNTCKSTFRWITGIRQHVGRYHSDVENDIYACSYCASSFKIANELNEHVRQHPRYKCFSCEVSFKTLIELKSHVKVHGAELYSEREGRALKSCALNNTDTSVEIKADKFEHGALIDGATPPQSAEMENPSAVDNAYTKRTENSATPSLAGMYLDDNGSDVAPDEHEEHLKLPETFSARHTQNLPNILTNIEHESQSSHKLYNETDRRDGSEYQDDGICQKIKERSTTSWENMNDNSKMPGAEEAEIREQSTSADGSIPGPPFICHICSNSYAYRRSLNVHLIAHTPRFQCDICNKRFPAKYHLDEHRERHLGVKAYKCSNCEDSFVNASSLRKHIAQRCKLKCNVCLKTFKLRTKFEDHITVHLQINENPKCGENVAIENQAEESTAKTDDLEPSNAANIVRMEAQHKVLKDAVCFGDEQEFKPIVLVTDEVTPIKTCDSETKNGTDAQEKIMNAGISVETTSGKIKMERIEISKEEMALTAILCQSKDYEKTFEKYKNRDRKHSKTKNGSAEIASFDVAEQLYPIKKERIDAENESEFSDNLEFVSEDGPSKD